ncbi:MULTISPECIES: hypothetical protein [Pseudomonas]|uniref:Uncharacterized protein n=1 Tax=Pseudomonas nitroreducens TaxID=46680 RepID=A0A6G6J9U8_PSENT|nr:MULTISPECIES: hypothetical protein [Pseudomonas]MDU4254136.1 hypothetical protein [Pseudomonas sp.]QIE91251.1 hypothetical protein G5B91_33370 [Pseudomonas nitroreducens]HBO6306045.1 hypothetical protein [Pseudomonas aeruginosa]
MNFTLLISRFNESVERRTSHELQLDSQISRLESASKASGGRIESRLSLAKHRRQNLHREHRGAADWRSAVAIPAFNILSKELGRSYIGAIVQGDVADSLRMVFNRSNSSEEQGPKAIAISMRSTGTPLTLAILKAVGTESGDWHEEEVSADTRIAELAACTIEKARL